MAAFAPDPSAPQQATDAPPPGEFGPPALDLPPEEAAAAPGGAPDLSTESPVPDGEAPPPPAADPFSVESMVAVLGLDAFVERRLAKVHLYQLTRASKVDDEINRKLHLFINRETPEKSADLPPFDFEAVRAAIEDPPASEQETADMIGAFGELADVGMAAVNLATRIIEYLKPKIPHRVHMGLLGPEQSPPPHSDVARFRRLWTVARDPLSILDDLNEFAVSRDMAQAVSEMYPQIFQRIDEGVTAQLMRKKAQSPKFRLTIRKELILRVLIRKEDAASMQLGQALQAQHAKDAAEAAPRPPQAKPKAERGSTDEASASDEIGH